MDPVRFRARLGRDLLVLLRPATAAALVAAGGGCAEETHCLDRESPDAECLDPMAASPELSDTINCGDPVTLIEEGENTADQCCYVLKAPSGPVTCIDGRPFVVAGEGRTAEVRSAPRRSPEGAGWADARLLPDVSCLPPALRARLAALWARG